MKCTILHRDTEDVLYEASAKSFRAGVVDAIEENVDLSWADLSGKNLCDVDLSTARLKHALLYGTRMRGVYLRDACLSYADLGDADLRDADLADPSLVDADLGGARLRNAYIHNAILVGTHIESVDLIDAGQDCRGYRFVAVRQQVGYMIAAGCRWFTAADAWRHWNCVHIDEKSLHVECLHKLELLIAVAKSRNWGTL